MKNYCGHVWGGAPSCYLELLDKLQKTEMQYCWSFICYLSWTLGSSSKYSQLESFYRCYFGRCSSKLAQLALLPCSWMRSTRYSDRLHDFSVTISTCYKDVYFISFFLCTEKLWNSLPMECFTLTYDLSGFNFRFNRHLLIVGSF